MSWIKNLLQPVQYPAEVTVSTAGTLTINVPKLLVTTEAKRQIEELRKLEEIMKYPSVTGRPPHGLRKP